MSDPEAEIKRFALFGDLAESEREELAEVLEPRELRDGETLFQQGNEADALLLLVDGRLDLSSHQADEQVQVGAGTALGALSLLAVGTREVTAIAAGSARVLLLRREDYRRLVEDSPRTACRLVEAIAAQAASDIRQALAAGAADSVDRVAASD